MIYSCTRIVYSADNKYIFDGSTLRQPWPLLIMEIGFGRNSLPILELPSTEGPDMRQILAEEKNRCNSCQAWLGLVPLELLTPAKLHRGCASATKTYEFKYRLKKALFSPTSAISVERHVSPESFPQYISPIFAASRYTSCLSQQRRHCSGPYCQPIIAAGIQEKRLPMRVGCPASLVAKIIDIGLKCKDTCILGYCAAFVFAFIFHFRSITVYQCPAHDLTVHPDGIIASFFRRKS